MTLSDIDENVRIESRVWNMVKYVVKQSGIYIFFVSAFLLTQTHVVRKYSMYGQIEVRIFLAIATGLLSAYGVSWLIKRIFSRFDRDSDLLLSNLSTALFPGVLLVFASANKNFIYISFGFCLLTALFIWVKPVSDFVLSIVYEDKFRCCLEISDGKALVKVTGTYVSADLLTVQSFLLDLAINLHECAEKKIKVVRFDLAGLKANKTNEIMKLVEPVADYFEISVNQ